MSIVKQYVPGLPVVSFRFSESYRQQNPEVEQKWVQTLLRAKGWIVPNYELAPDLSDIEILRVVVRENLTAVLVDRLVADIVSGSIMWLLQKTCSYQCLKGRDRGEAAGPAICCTCFKCPRCQTHK